PVLAAYSSLRQRKWHIHRVQGKVVGVEIFMVFGLASRRLEACSTHWFPLWSNWGDSGIGFFNTPTPHA
ncbi:MAG: hypothetical protein ACKVOR_14430, partial [Flavobacteriales bacterium]